MIKAIIMMLVVGAVLGIVLGISAKVFYVKPDTRVEDITKMLPGYNCGGCGYPGCAGMAEALVNKESEVTSCKPSKPEAKEAIKQYLQQNAA
ncbi:MAG: (Fe-S)-binding protein [Firmicutes bacterium]|nr:electron transporter RnfB [Erysipelotrichaceae bacterium]MDD6524635.1 (Fe-S)-binding protein [Bacillota bacterium]MDD7227803.1 (Fe-S)-binding protein [Bacillota bacterium]MDY5998047.1 (Fe-S)-binding protein [Erysipelotrichaceae bacterium]